MEEAATRLNAKELFGTVLKCLKGSTYYALIPAILFYSLYDMLSIQSIGDAFVVGAIVFICIIFNLAIFNEEISWLLNFVPSWLKAHKRKQVAPLGGASSPPHPVGRDQSGLYAHWRTSLRSSLFSLRKNPTHTPPLQKQMHERR
jgi:hypothetical protein